MKQQRQWAKASLLVMSLFVSACADDVAPTTLQIALPLALVDCAQPPAAGELKARLWTSGFNAPCPLQINDDGVSGDCVVTAGIERIFTLDWFVVDAVGTTVVLAQARRTVDLAGATEATLKLEFTDADYVVDDCLDMSSDSFAGSATLEIDGTARPVCDLDDDGSTNVVEICAGRDPLGRL